MLKWFKECKTQKEAKTLYHKLCRKYHPDLTMTDTTAIMQEINNEFSEVFDRLPKGDGRAATAEQSNSTENTDRSNSTTKQTAERFMKIIQRLVKCEGLEIEIVGSWIWVSGAVYKYLRCIKGMGFVYSTKHKKYYLADDEGAGRRGSRYTFEQICDKYGVEHIESDKTAKLTM